MSRTEKVTQVALKIVRLNWQIVSHINCRAALVKGKVALI